MRLSASEKLEIIGLVEQSHLPARRTALSCSRSRPIPVADIMLRTLALGGLRDFGIR